MVIIFNNTFPEKNNTGVFWKVQEIFFRIDIQKVLLQYSNIQPVHEGRIMSLILSPISAKQVPAKDSKEAKDLKDAKEAKEIKVKETV